MKSTWDPTQNSVISNGLKQLQEGSQAIKCRMRMRMRTKTPLPTKHDRAPRMAKIGGPGREEIVKILDEISLLRRFFGRANSTSTMSLKLLASKTMSKRQTIALRSSSAVTFWMPYTLGAVVLGQGLQKRLSGMSPVARSLGEVGVHARRCGRKPPPKSDHDVAYVLLFYYHQGEKVRWRMPCMASGHIVDICPYPDAPILLVFYRALLYLFLNFQFFFFFLIWHKEIVLNMKPCVYMYISIFYCYDEFVLYSIKIWAQHLSFQVHILSRPTVPLLTAANTGHIFFGRLAFSIPCWWWVC
ncbi:Hep59 superfamily domain-containing protein [Histoplasma ohiense]|nr:Hep59 superfamily domain-containing protein [Histoplasma ohiense (nom. inval.)]